MFNQRDEGVKILYVAVNWDWRVVFDIYSSESNWKVLPNLWFWIFEASNNSGT